VLLVGGPVAEDLIEVARLELCQMGLQFVHNKLAALRKMRRVLNASGRAFVTVLGPKPPLSSS
jgi:ubiquinone/menaquinone biosynthesis C-methylase UbiE